MNIGVHQLLLINDELVAIPLPMIGLICSRRRLNATCLLIDEALRPAL